MIYILTGATGFLGGSFLNYLNDLGEHEIYVVTRESSLSKSSTVIAPSVNRNSTVLQYKNEVDEIYPIISDLEINNAVLLHFAGPSYDDCNNNFEGSIDYKRKILRFLISLSSDIGAKLITFSSVHVKQVNNLKQGDKGHLDKYKECHLAGEEIFRQHYLDGGNCQLFRICNILGAPQYKSAAAWSLVACSFAKNIVENHEIHIKAPLDTARSFYPRSSLNRLLYESSLSTVKGFHDIHGFEMPLIALASIMAYIYKCMHDVEIEVVCEDRRFLYEDCADFILDDLINSDLYADFYNDISSLITTAEANYC